MSLEIDKALIKKYLEGSCSGEELAKVKDFLKQENASQVFDEVWDELWLHRMKTGAAGTDPRQMSAWKEKIRERIANEPSETHTASSVRLTIRKWRYAAVWTAVIMGIGLWMLHFKKTKQSKEIVYVEKYNPYGRRTIITLSDSSQVYLGAGSRLRFAKTFEGNTREINLEGEAFFEVTKNPKRPFIIHTGILTTRVLGTSFKVEAFKGKSVTVAVSTGKVRVDRHLNGTTESIAVLIPGQTVTWNEAAGLKTMGTAVTSDVTRWKDGRLVFNQSPLSDISAVLERWYNVRISFKNRKTGTRLMKINLTANVPINTLMDILATAGQFKYHIKGNQITII